MKAYVKCPLDGTEQQKFCGLVEHYKDNGITHECSYQQECTEMKTHIINTQEGNLNETK